MKIKNSLGKINYKLFLALLVMGLCPTIYTTLRVFFLGEDNILSNREMHINYKEVNSSTEETVTREQIILEILEKQPKITLQEIADKIGKSLRTVKTSVKVLQESGKVERVGGKKNGSWRVL